MEAEESSPVQPFVAASAAATTRTNVLTSEWVAPGRLLWIVVVLGAALRIYRYDALGLWIDEGYTVMFARMSWADVLGLHGAYDPSPPLYFALTKVATLFAPELTAGRIVSLIAGVVTIPVLYALVRRLSNGWIALAASLVLAISPLHVWFSQEARQYLLTMLFVAVSYLSLVAFHHTEGRGWAAAYGVSVLLAMYSNYSALYALLPQAAIVAWLVKSSAGKYLPLTKALALAVVGYLPWIPAWISAIQQADPFRVNYLGVSPERVASYSMSVAGLAGNGQYFAGKNQLPWEAWPSWQWAMVISIVPIVVVGSVVLIRQNRLGFAIMMASSAGAIVLTVLLSLVSPGFAVRTILYALIGWAFVAGAAVYGAGLPRWINTVGLLSFIFVIGYSLFGLGLIYAGADKQHWDEVARDVALVEPLKKPVLIVRPLDYTLIDVYQAHILDKGQMITSTQGLTTFDPVSADAVWFAYHDTDRFDNYHQELRDLGYERIMHKYYYNPMYLDLYARPGARLGQPVRLNGNFNQNTGRIDGWDLPPGGWQVQSDGAQSSSLTLHDGASITARIAVTSTALYTLQVEAQVEAASTVTETEASIRVACLDKSGTELDATDGPVSSLDARWHTFRVSDLCPGGTQAVEAKLSTARAAPVSFRNVALYRADLAKTDDTAP